MKPTGHFSESLLEAILENAVDAIITIDSQGIMLAANPASERMFGYSIDELIGKNINLLMPSPDREQHDSYIHNYLSTRIAKIIRDRSRSHRASQGWLDFSDALGRQRTRCRWSSPVRRNRSRHFGFEERRKTAGRMEPRLEQKVIERTSELRDAQAELVRKEKLALLGQVSANISHEIRNPLNAAKTSAYYLMNAKSPSPDKMTEHLERIDRQIEMIDSVVTALTDLAKLPEPRETKIDLAQLVDQTISGMTMPAEIDISISDESDRQMALADQNQIAMVIRNIVRNARDAMPDGGSLNVRVEDQDGNLEVIVEDTGCGISAEDLSRIMDPFFSTKARGMGLGLSIIQAILKKNGGQIEVESQIGKGSRFRFSLPKYPDSPSA